MKRSAGPGNDGMLVDLKMGKKRIVDLGNAVDNTDAPNKKQLDNIATVLVPYRTPYMTSNTTPVPFTTSAPIASPTAWKGFSDGTGFYSTNAASQDVSLTLDFGSTQTINFMELQLSTLCDSISVFDHNDDLLATSRFVNGSVFVKFDPVSTYKVLVVIVQVDVLVMVSQMAFGYRVVDFNTTILVSTIGREQTEAVNVGFFNARLLPLTSSIVPVYTNPPMTSDIEPYPYVANSFIVPLPYHDAYKAFDFDITTSWKAVAVASVPMTVGIDIPTPLSVVAFEVAGPSDNYDVTTTNFIFTAVRNIGTAVTLFVSNTPLPQVPTVFEVQTNEEFVSFELTLTPKTIGAVVSVGLFNIFTKAVSLKQRRLVNVSQPISDDDATNKRYVDDTVASRLSLSGGTMSGDINMAGNKITSIASQTFDKGDVLNRQSTLSASLSDSLTGGLLAMSRGAILANIIPVDINGSVPVHVQLSGSGDLVPNPTSGDYFAFNSDDSLEVVAGEYEAVVQLQFVDTSDPVGFITITIKDVGGQDLTSRVVAAASSCVVKVSLYLTVAIQTSIILTVSHSGAFTKLIGGLWGLYKPATGTTARRVLMGLKLPNIWVITNVFRQLPLIVGNQVPLGIIAANIGINANTIVVSRFTGIMKLTAMFELRNGINAPQTVDIELTIVDNNVTTVRNFGPYGVQSRISNGERSIRVVPMTAIIPCTGQLCTIAFAMKCSHMSMVSVYDCSIMVGAV